MTGSDKPHQWFHFGASVYSIDAAKALIAASPRSTHNLAVQAWARAYGLTTYGDPNPRAISLFGPAPGSLNREYAMATNLSEPVIVATFDTAEGPAPLLIDGVHRLYKAFKTGETQLPAHVLTIEETQHLQQIRQHRPHRTRSSN